MKISRILKSIIQDGLQKNKPIQIPINQFKNLTALMSITLRVCYSILNSA